MREKDNGWIKPIDRPLRWWALFVLWSIAAFFVASEPAHAADSYTTNLRIVQQVAGTNANTWGTKANAAFAMLDEAISKVTSISLTAGNVTLSTANNATDQSRSAVLVFTGTPGTTRTVTAPNVQKVYYVYNNSDGAITFGSGGGTTVSVPIGAKAVIYDDAATNSVALSLVSSFAATVLDDATAAAARTTLGLGTGDTQQFAKLGLGMAATNVLDITQTQDASSYGQILNGSAGTSSKSAWRLSNGTNTVEYGLLGTSYSGTGVAAANAGYVLASSNLALNAGTSSNILFGIGTGIGTERMRLSSAGLGIGMTPAQSLDITKTQDAATIVNILNSSAGIGSYTGIQLSNGTAAGALFHFGTGFNASGLSRQGGTALYGNGVGGLTIGTQVAQPVYIGVNNIERALIDANGTGGKVQIDGTSGANSPLLNIIASGFWTYGIKGNGNSLQFLSDSTTLMTLTGGGGLQVGAPTGGDKGAGTVNATGFYVNGANLYEEGTWTPTDQSGASLTFTSVSAAYTKIGRMVFAYGQFTFPSTGSSADILIGGLPYSAANANYAKFAGRGTTSFSTSIGEIMVPNSATFNITDGTTVILHNSTFSTRTVNFSLTYPAS